MKYSILIILSLFATISIEASVLDRASWGLGVLFSDSYTADNSITANIKTPYLSSNVERNYKILLGYKLDSFTLEKEYKTSEHAYLALERSYFVNEVPLVTFVRYYLGSDKSIEDKNFASLFFKISLGVEYYFTLLNKKSSLVVEYFMPYLSYYSTDRDRIKTSNLFFGYSIYF
jgi:hypothetical protein